MSEGNEAAEHTQMLGGGAEVKYPMTEEKWARVDRDCTYHVPQTDQLDRYVALQGVPGSLVFVEQNQTDQLDRYVALREAARQFEIRILTLTPASHEQSLALTHLENAIFFANDAIARNE